MKRALDPAIGGIINCLELYLHDDIISVDGTPIIPTYEQCLGSYVGTYLDVIAERITFKPNYDSNGKYCGVVADLPSKITGFYCIGYEHPIDGTASYYVGSTIKCIRDRLGMLSRLVMTGKATGNESLTVANKWVEKHGRNLDYAFITYFPSNFPQTKLRKVETEVLNHYRRLFGTDVLNVAEKAVRTLEWSPPTPPLEGL